MAHRRCQGLWLLKSRRALTLVVLTAIMCRMNLGLDSISDSVSGAALRKYLQRDKKPPQKHR